MRQRRGRYRLRPRREGTGYLDLGFAVLAESGLVGPHTTIATTVHPLQIIDGPLPETAHDFRFGALSRHDAIIACSEGRRPDGVFWDQLAPKKTAIAVLADQPSDLGDTEAKHVWP